MDTKLIKHFEDKFSVQVGGEAMNESTNRVNFVMETWWTMESTYEDGVPMVDAADAAWIRASADGRWRASQNASLQNSFIYASADRVHGMKNVEFQQSRLVRNETVDEAAHLCA